jgi:hypothetical protein
MQVMKFDIHYARVGEVLVKLFEQIWISTPKVELEVM